MGNQTYWLAVLIANGFVLLKTESEALEMVSLIVMLIALILVHAMGEKEVDKRR